MVSPHKIVISASRRTDIPAFYMDWFFKQLKQGFFEVENPFNHRIRRVPITSKDVHTLVFWSKNFEPFLKNNSGERLQSLGYHLFFNFSLNSTDPLLEPKVPPLSERLLQLAALSRRFGPESITWRFDPICFYRVNQGPLQDNLGEFTIISETAADCGITRCVTSFIDQYGKVRRRARKQSNITFENIILKKKVKVVHKMAKQLHRLNISLKTCCEKEVVEAVDDENVLTAAGCIPNDLLMTLYGGELSLKKDSGQRVKAGCGCNPSIDIGSYGFHPCYHDCLFCYANPACDNKIQKINREMFP